MVRYFIPALIYAGLHAASAHAQAEPIVQCHIGVLVKNVPAYACDPLIEAYGKLGFTNKSNINVDAQKCADVLNRYFTNEHNKNVSICFSMWKAAGFAEALRRS